MRSVSRQLLNWTGAFCVVFVAGCSLFGPGLTIVFDGAQRAASGIPGDTVEFFDGRGQFAIRGIMSTVSLCMKASAEGDQDRHRITIRVAARPSGECLADPGGENVYEANVLNLDPASYSIRVEHDGGYPDDSALPFETGFQGQVEVR